MTKQITQVGDIVRVTQGSGVTEQQMVGKTFTVEGVDHDLGCQRIYIGNTVMCQNLGDEWEIETPVTTPSVTPVPHLIYDVDTTPGSKGTKTITFSKGGSFMSRLSLLAKKAFDKETKTLIKTGVLNSDLEVQNEQFVLSFLVDKYKTELAALAQEQLDEAKKEA